MTFKTRHTTTWIDRSALPVRLRASSVPSDCNRSPRGASGGLVSWRQELGKGGGGARTVGEDPSGHSRSVGEIAEPRVRAAHGHIIYIPGVAAGAGEGMDGGPWVDMRGFVTVWYTQSEDVIPFDVLDHRLRPPDEWAAQNLG